MTIRSREYGRSANRDCRPDRRECARYLWLSLHAACCWRPPEAGRRSGPDALWSAGGFAVGWTSSVKAWPLTVAGWGGGRAGVVAGLARGMRQACALSNCPAAAGAGRLRPRAAAEKVTLRLGLGHGNESAPRPVQTGEMDREMTRIGTANVVAAHGGARWHGN